jgi:hypothetical protein
MERLFHQARNIGNFWDNFKQRLITFSRGVKQV